MRNVVDEDDILKSAANAESLSSSFPISDLGHRLGAILHDFFGYYPTQRSFVACGNSCAPGPGIPNWGYSFDIIRIRKWVHWIPQRSQAVRGKDTGLRRVYHASSCPHPCPIWSTLEYRLSYKRAQPQTSTCYSLCRPQVHVRSKQWPRPIATSTASVKYTGTSPTILFPPSSTSEQVTNERSYALDSRSYAVPK